MPRVLPAAFAVMFSASTWAANFPTPFNSEKTPGEPMPAEEVAAKWDVPEGFKVRVFAAEPDVRNPIGCAWDARGRLWVAENFTYAERPVKWESKLRDRVLIFEDADGDGHHDKRTVFTDEVQHLTSVEVGRGGVWLMCPPQLLFIPDKDGNDEPDGPAEVVLDGFDLPSENYHNLANGLRWGPDGWLYGRVGASAPGKIGAPGTPDDQRIPLAGGIWRYHPERKVFEAFCHGTTNPWGHDWNEDGELFFTNTVNGHLWHAIAGAHFERPHTIDPNPHVYELMGQTADHYHFDTGKGWTASRDGAANDFGGGHAHCGAMIYLGDNWPDSFRGKLYTLNFHGRRMNVERLERMASGYVGKHDGDLFVCPDPFFRGIDLTYGPDGGVYVLDWSDTGECHEATGVHRTSGRIYKITHGDAKMPDIGDLAKLSNEELVKLHDHKNEWFVRMARRVLVDRMTAGAPVAGAISLLQEHLRSRTSEGHQPSASPIAELSTLFALNGADHDFLTELYRIPEPSDPKWDDAVRALAVRLLVDSYALTPVDGRPLHARKRGDLREGDDPVATALSGEFSRLAANEKSPVVRLALASALSRLPEPARGYLARALAMHGEDDDDHNLPLMIWYGVQPMAQARLPREPYYDQLAWIAEGCELRTTRRLIARLLAARAENNSEPLSDLMTLACNKPPAFQSDILTGLLEGFTGWRKAPKPESWDAFAAKVNESGDAGLMGKVRELGVLFGDGRALDDVKKLALDDKADLGARKSALKSLIDAKPDDLRAICENLLSVRFLNTVAVRGLAQFDDPAISQKLAQSYKNFHPSERGAVIETLVSRPTFAKALLDAIANEKIPRDDVSAFNARQIRSFNDDALTRHLGEVWGEIHDSAQDKRESIASLKSQLTPETLAQAEKLRGRVTFEQLCATCHTLYGSGGQVGPDLTGSGRAN
ncbi:MAG: PVC-type heme-binding CxxCH protein, partial [Chthoniobacteraceae bacterium]